MERNPDIVSIFSEFILGFRESGDRTIPIWRSDPKLQQNMQRLVELDRDATEEFWARYFLRVLREELEAESCGGQDYAKGHLFAYLQRFCYFVALKLNRKHSGVDFLRRLYTYQDYFQIANSSASNPSQVLQNFQFNLPSTVKAYTRQRLEGIVIGEIRKQNKHVDWDKYKRWGLLRNAGLTELRASLKGRMNLNEVEQHVLAWQCFKEIYVPKTSTGSRHLDSPNKEEFQQISQRYNQRRLELSESGEAMNEDRVTKMLEDCIQAVRDGRTVHASYPDAHRDTLEAASDYGWDTIIQDVPEYGYNEPSARLEQEEEWNQINAILSEAFDQLPTCHKSLLILYLGLECTQKETGLVLNLKQYQVARQYQRCKRFLLGAFAQGCKKSLNLHLSHETIVQLNAPLVEWLEKHCRQLLTSLLEAILSKNSGDTRLLQRDYGQELSQEAAEELGIYVSDIQPKLLDQLIYQRFTIYLAECLAIHMQSLNSIANRVEVLAENLLQTIARSLH